MAVRAMSGAERVVHVDVGERRQQLAPVGAVGIPDLVTGL